MEEFSEASVPPEKASAEKERTPEQPSRFLDRLWQRMGWFTGRSEASDPRPDSDEPEEEDESETERMPKSRTQRIREWLVGSLVSREPIETKKSPKDRDDTIIAEETASEPQESAEISSAPTPDTGLKETAPSAVEAAEPRPAVETDAETMLETNGEKITEDAESVKLPATSAEAAKNLPPPPEVAPPLMTEFIVPSGGSAAATPEVQPLPTTLPEHQHGEPIGWLAALGVLAERFGRKWGERKLHRQAKRQEAHYNRELAKVHEALDTQTRRREQLQRQIQTRKEEIMAHVTPSFEKSKPSSQKLRPAEEPRVVVERETSNEQLALTPEVKTAPPLPPVSPETIANLVERHYERTQPEAVLHEVEEAVEKNIPLEGLYERQQEIKDEPAADDRAKTKTAPGVSRAGVAAGGLSMALQSLASDTTSPASAQPTAASNLYKNAAISGVWGGLIIVIFFIILLVVGR